MVSGQTRYRVPGKTSKYAYPSRYGSHKVMVVESHEDGWVTCKDEFGTYKTTIDRLDSGLTDSRRCAEHRLTKLFQGSKKEC